ncbi:hypothetical protein GF324_00865 [bacterium]|nr:hypothetical protein [bacterium]
MNEGRRDARIGSRARNCDRTTTLHTGVETMKARFWVWFALVAGLAVFGCSDDDDNGSGPDDNNEPEGEGVWVDEEAGGGFYARLDATAYDAYAYLSLADGEVVTVNDPMNDNGWDLAFSRYNGKLNGGISGSAEVVGVDLDDIGHQHAMDYYALNEVPDVAEDEWEADAYDLMVGDNWYNYNPQTHEFSVNNNIFVLNDTDGNYAKFRFPTLEGGGMGNMGTITIEYVYNADGSNDLNGDPVSVELDGSDGEIYFSFSEGGEVEVADRMSSTAWDLYITGFDVYTNGGVSGPGDCAVYPMYQDEDDFEAVTMAPEGAPFFSDAVQSVFIGSVNETGSAWYEYNPQVHELVSKGHVYVIKATDDKHYKLEITNYYKEVDGEADAGWVTMRYAALD